MLFLVMLRSDCLFWDLPRDVLAAPDSPLCSKTGVILSLCVWYALWDVSGDVLAASESALGGRKGVIHLSPSAKGTVGLSWRPCVRESGTASQYSRAARVSVGVGV